MNWKVGDISQRTGLTVRTLHYYEELGLIGPIGRNQSGHRVYVNKDLLRLQQIAALKQLGFPLHELKGLLAESNADIQGLIAKQLEHIKQQRSALDTLERRLESLKLVLHGSNEDISQLNEILFKTMEAMTMYDKYFDEQQLKQMHDHGHIDADGKTSSIEESWNAWTDQLRQLVKAGADPQGKEAQALMSHWQELVSHLTGGDATQLQSFNDLFHSEAQARQDHGIDDAMFEFMGKASTGH